MPSENQKFAPQDDATQADAPPASATPDLMNMSVDEWINGTPTTTTTESIAAEDVPSANESAHEATAQFDLGDLALVPKEENGGELDAQGSAMEHLIATTPEVTNLGNELNRVEAGATTSESTEAQLNAILDNPEKLPEELKGVNPEVLKSDAQEIVSELSKKSPEELAKMETGIHNFGYKLEKWKNGKLADAFKWVGEKIASDEGLQSSHGNKGTVARFVAGLSANYNERNGDLDTKMEKLEESRKNGGMGVMQKAGSVMQVTGPLLRYGRIASDAIGWTAAAPWRFGQLAATIGETVLSAGKEARLKNEDVIDQTRIQESAEAEEEAYAMYTAQMEKQGIEITKDEKGRVQLEGVSTKQLSAEYTKRIPQDLLNRLGRAPKNSEGDGVGTGLVQDAMRYHIGLEAKSMQTKIDALEADKTLSSADREKRVTQTLEAWGNSKMLKDFDRLLSQQGVVDGIAMSARYGSKAAKAASMALSAQSLLLLWDKFGGLPAWSDVADKGASMGSAIGSASKKVVDMFTSDAHAGELPGTMAHPGLSAEGTVPQFTETSTGLNVSTEDLATAEHDATWKESSSGLLMTEEDLIISESGVQASEKGGVYEVKSGDTITSILKTKFPGITNTQIENLRGQNLKDFGIQSGNLDKIGLSDKLDMSKIEEAIKNGKGTGGASLGLTGAASASNGGSSGGAGGDMGGAKASFASVFEPQQEERAALVVSETTETSTTAVAEEAVTSQAKGVEDRVPTPKTEVIREAPTKGVVAERLTPDQQATGVVAEKLNAQYTERDAVMRPAVMERTSGGAVLDSRMGAAERAYEGTMARIDAQEEQRLSSIETAYRNQVERLTMSKENALANKNVQSVNKGIGAFSKILQGKQVNIGQVLMNEGTTRLQGGISAENRYAQALNAAQAKYEKDLSTARDTFARMRSNAENTQMLKQDRLLEQIDKAKPGTRT